jgi:CheY-like chemotaxis protein
VVTDQTMPGLTGLEFARGVKQLRPDLPIFLCTGYSEQVDDETCTAAGIDAWFQKPIDLDELLGALAHALCAKIPID